MQRVFYFSGYRMTIFDWDRRRLVGSVDFQPDEQGFQDFEYTLEHSVTMPAYLLVDLIEEDFRRTTIPHANPMDRKMLIARTLERNYREEEFAHASLIGRTTVGRKDDQLLLSALTHPELLDPWLERMQRHDVLLAGIWSLPLLSERVMNAVAADEEHALLVSRDVRSALRISYMQRGKLVLSRLVKFSKEMWDNDTLSGVIDNLERGTVELYNFLTNQHIMRGDERLSVHCILPQAQIADARRLSGNGVSIRYQFVVLESLFKHFGLTECEGCGAAALLSWHCTRVNPLRDHYGKPEQKSMYYRYLVNRLITHTVEISGLLCITAAVLLSLQGLELDRQRVIVAGAFDQMQSEYDRRFGDEAEKLASAHRIADSVRVLDRIQADSQQAPHRYFGTLSRVLARPEFDTVHLNEIDWNKYEADEIRSRLAALARDGGMRNERSDGANVSGMTDSADESDTLDSRPAVLTLKGTIDTRGRTYRDTIDKMQRFVTQLESLPDTRLVRLVRTPVDIRESSRFSDAIGKQTSAAPMGEGSDSFEVMIVMAPIHHA